MNDPKLRTLLYAYMKKRSDKRKAEKSAVSHLDDTKAYEGNDGNTESTDTGLPISLDEIERWASSSRSNRSIGTDIGATKEWKPSLRIDETASSNQSTLSKKSTASFVINQST